MSERRDLTMCEDLCTCFGASPSPTTAIDIEYVDWPLQSRMRQHVLFLPSPATALLELRDADTPMCMSSRIHAQVRKFEKQPPKASLFVLFITLIRPRCIPIVICFSPFHTMPGPEAMDYIHSKRCCKLWFGAKTWCWRLEIIITRL